VKRIAPMSHRAVRFSRGGANASIDYPIAGSHRFGMVDQGVVGRKRVSSNAITCISAIALVALGSNSYAEPTPAGAVLLRFDGLPHIPEKARARMKTATVTPHESSYRPELQYAKTKSPLAWQLKFGTIEDPETHYHYVHDVSVTLLENKEFVCNASTADLVVDADKVSFKSDKIRSAMMLSVKVDCVRSSDGYRSSCMGSVGADGMAPMCDHPYAMKGIKPWPHQPD
jgi:hypothetical protein